MTPKAWADEDVMIFWLKNVWHQNASRRLLIWDSFSGHRTKTVKELKSLQNTIWIWRLFQADANCNHAT